MKYVISIVCALALSAALTACGNNEGSKPAPSPQATPQVTPAPSVTPGPESKADHDFRGTDWGMTVEEVKKTEPMKPKVDKLDSLTYEGRYKRRVTYFNYKFKDGKLYRGGVVYPEKMDSPDIYMKNYEDLKKDIITAYGKPVLDGEKQINPKAVIDPDKKADAVCKGDLVYAAQWNLPRSMVVLIMQGNGKDCLTSLIYVDWHALQSIAAQDGLGAVDIEK